LERRVQAWARRHRLLVPGLRVGVAVSGGADSVALLRLLHEWSEEWGLLVAVVHVDHGWRPDSAADAAWVEALARRLGLEFHLRSLLAPPSGNREQWARQARYAYFEELIAASHAQRVATAHTADDQAETVLLRLLRGAGPAGLAGILPARGGLETPAGQAAAVTVIRPLLSVSRQELRAWLRTRGQDWREDPSNADLSLARNRLRHRYMPGLQAEFNAALPQRLAALAEVSRAEEEFWAAYLTPLVAQCFEIQPGQWRGSRRELARLPLAVRRRIVRAAITVLQGHLRHVNFDPVEAVVTALDDPTGPPRQFRAGRVEFHLRGPYITIQAAPGL